MVGANLEDNAGGVDAGSAYIFRRNLVGVWFQVQKLLASDGEADDRFGADVAMSGDFLAVGAPREDAPGGQSGAVYMYNKTGATTWTESQKLEPSDAQNGDFFCANAFFPTGLDLDGDSVVDVWDLQMLLGSFGACSSSSCGPDLNADGAVDGMDVVVFVRAWRGRDRDGATMTR